MNSRENVCQKVESVKLNGVDGGTSIEELKCAIKDKDSIIERLTSELRCKTAELDAVRSHIKKEK